MYLPLKFLKEGHARFDHPLALGVYHAGSWPKEKSSEAGIKVLSHNNRIMGNDVSNNFNGILLRGEEYSL